MSHRNVHMVYGFILFLALSVLGCSEKTDTFHTISKEAIQNQSNYYVLDPVVGHIHKSNVTFSYPWPEHKDGKITVKTDNFGFKRDSDIQQEKQNKIRILVTGDSHTDGVINNSESCCALLENLLNKSSNKTFEVINGGCGFYYTRNYLRFLEKYSFLSPDVYIVILYGGNDFLESCKLERCQRSSNNDYYERLKKINTIDQGALWQGFNQLYYFKFFPQSEQIAFNSMTADLEKIKQICQAKHIKFIVLLLPNKMDMEWSSDAARLNQCKELLQLTDDDLQINEKLLAKMANWLTANHISHLNLSTVMKDQEQPVFWQKDYHLNDYGHKLIAEALFKNYKDLFLGIPTNQPSAPK